MFSLLIIGFSFLVLGIFLSLSNNLQHLASELARSLGVIVFLEKNISSQEKEALQRKIQQSPLVAKVEYVSPEEAKARFEKHFPELQEALRDLGTIPFPPSFEITIKDRLSRSPGVLRFLDDLRREKRVQDIQFNRDWVERLESLDRLIRAIGLFLASILILAAFFIVSNVIRLSVIARADEISILRLVGATNTFIRIPFLLEGMVLGVLGSGLALGLLWMIIKLFPLYVGYSLGAFQQLINLRSLTLPQALGLIAGGGLVGFLGSLSSLSRFLKI